MSDTEDISEVDAEEEYYQLSDKVRALLLSKRKLFYKRCNQQFKIQRHEISIQFERNVPDTFIRVTGYVYGANRGIVYFQQCVYLRGLSVLQNFDFEKSVVNFLFEEIHSYLQQVALHYTD